MKTPEDAHFKVIYIICLWDAKRQLYSGILLKKIFEIVSHQYKISCLSKLVFNVPLLFSYFRVVYGFSYIKNVLMILSWCSTDVLFFFKICQMSVLELNCENSKQLNELISEKDVQRGFQQLDMAGILQNIFIFKSFSRRISSDT